MFATKPAISAAQTPAQRDPPSATARANSSGAASAFMIWPVKITLWIASSPVR